jgi:signal transduction histidine kinase
VGTGIGLSTVDALTNAAGGSLWIETDDSNRLVAASFKLPRYEAVMELQINTQQIGFTTLNS